MRERSENMGTKKLMTRSEMIILVDLISAAIVAEQKNVASGESGDASHLEDLHLIYSKVSAAWIEGTL